jgi:hypothetical protein
MNKLRHANLKRTAINNPSGPLTSSVALKVNAEQYIASKKT